MLAQLQAWVEMSDGVRLHATLTRPDVPHPVPVVLIRTPYLPFTPVGIDVVGIAARGVAVVVQSVRGTGRSEGEFEPFLHEADDGAETAAWCAAQHWSNGRVGTMGRSYLALTQNYTTARCPEAIAAMALEVVPGRPYDWVYPGGAFLEGMLLYWSMRHVQAGMARAEDAGSNTAADQALWQRQMARFDETMRTAPVGSISLLDRYFPTWRQWREHPRDDEWWQARDRPGGPQTAVPALYVGGWHDLFLAGTLDGFTANTHPDSRLVVGPWAHTAKGSALGQVNYGFEASAVAVDLDGQVTDFVLAHLRGESPDPRRARVQIFVMGANRWRDAQQWPPEGTTGRELFLQPSGRLTPTPPTDAAEVGFAFDPGDPVPTLGGANFFIGSDGGCLTGQRDQRELDDRRDVLRFVSEPLPADAEVIGRVSVTLSVATSAASADWTAKLVDVHPDGRALNVVDGIGRVHAAPTDPGAVADVAITPSATPRSCSAADIASGWTSPARTTPDSTATPERPRRRDQRRPRATGSPPAAPGDRTRAPRTAHPSHGRGARRLKWRFDTPSSAWSLASTSAARSWVDPAGAAVAGLPRRRWHDGGVDQVVQFLSHFWWLIFVFGGTIGAVLKAIGAANERRLDRRQERYRLKQQAKIAAAQARSHDQADELAQRREIDKTIEEHDQTDAKWFAYEIDPVTLLDFPMMTDLREPLTVEFHKAKRRADLLRPATAEALMGDLGAQRDYREAVHSYVVAFDIAEAEAKRRRRGGFTRDEQEHLVRAQSLLRLAMDEGATSAERQSAYRKAQRELEGLILLPSTMRAEIERHIAGQIEA